MNMNITKKEREAAREIVKSPHWEWMPGMLAQMWEEDLGLAFDAGLRLNAHNMYHVGDRLPDLGDPATKGCILELVRSLWGDPGFYVTRVTGRKDGEVFFMWEFFGSRNGVSTRGFCWESEALALIGALEESGGLGDTQPLSDG